ncbi:MAG TPA: Ig-like domain-containing protein [Anaerohalosphaeraceae bacterium]|nr:Ig-like domain-containing protein [Anaerohalosphaeraceae bacterium]
MKTLKHFPFAQIAHKTIACLLTFCMVNLPVWALDAGDASVSAGTAVIHSPAANTVSVDLITPRAVVDWTQMNAAGTETLNFAGASGFAVLNRVQSAVHFDGSLNGIGGHVFVVSPNGVVIGPNAVITASAFTAAGLNISNANFMSGVYAFVPFTGGVTGDVVNQGRIHVTEQAALLGRMVTNSGTIVCPSGLVLMAAGESVFLSTSGSNVIVEVDGVNAAAAGAGDVINSGTIQADEGQIILAAGDIYSSALGIRPEEGIGRVIQSGHMHADGTAAGSGSGGSILLTASDEVLLAAGSSTTANAIPDGIGPDRPDGGSIVLSSANTVRMDTDAFVKAKGNGWYDIDNNLRYDLGTDPDFRGSIQVAGRYIVLPSPDDYASAVAFRNHIDLMPWSGNPEQVGLLTAGPLTGDLHIANGDAAGMPAANTIYEEWIEDVSKAGINVDLLSPADILIADLNPGEPKDLGLVGGSGDLSFRTMFQDGGISLADIADLIATSDGGNLFMLAGSGGISVGDLKTYTSSSDKVTDSGQIFLLTSWPQGAETGADISTGSITVNGGGNSEISVIATGSLTVNGDVISTRNSVPQQDPSVRKALVCLIAGENVTVRGDIASTSHGKYATTAAIRVSGGWDVVIGNSSSITAEAKTSEQGPYKADASVVLQAGWNKNNADGIITLNGIAYNDQPGGSNSAYASLIKVSASVSGIGQNASVKTSDSWSENDPLPAASDDGSHKFWKDEKSKGSATAAASILIDNTEEVPPADPASPCVDCPTPPFLPPLPPILLILDDAYLINNKYVVNFGLDVLGNDGPNETALDGEIIWWSNGTSGTITPIYDASDPTKIIGFEYTPNLDTIVFEWDGTSDYASFTDTFRYKAKDADGNISLNKATVTIEVRNLLPVAQPDEYTESHNVLLQADGTPAGVIEGMIPAASGDYDLDAGDTLKAILVDGPVWGTVVLNPDGTFVYTPSAGNTTGTDSFTYKVTDGFNESNTTTVTLNLTNADPVAYDNSYGVSHNVQLTVSSTDGTITGTLNGAAADYDPDNANAGKLFDDVLTVVPLTNVPTANGGTVTLQADGSFVYTPSPDNKTGTDSFTYTLLDGFGGSDTAVVTINLTNADPVAYDNSYGVSHNVQLTVSSTDGTITGTLNGAAADYDPDNANAGKLFDDVLTVVPLTNVPTANGGTVTLQADGSFVYTPSPDNKTGTDSFTYTLLDGFGGSSTAVVTITLSNQLPIARPDNYGTQQDVTLIVTKPNDVITGVIPDINGDYDPDNSNEGKVFDDVLNAVLAGDGTTALGGKVILNGDGTFTYIPPAGQSGTDSFTYFVTDGYGNSNTVVVTIAIEGSFAVPAAPLPVLELPQLKGCPVVMDAVAAELGVHSDQLQMMIRNSLAANPNLQPCEACENLLNAAATLKGIDAERLGAMNQIFNTLAPADAPFTPEVRASVQMAFEGLAAREIQLAEMTPDEYAQYQQYAMTNEIIEAFVRYVAVLNSDLKLPIGNPVAMAVEKYGASITNSENPNMAAYIIARMEAAMQ